MKEGTNQFKRVLRPVEQLGPIVNEYLWEKGGIPYIFEAKRKDLDLAHFLTQHASQIDDLLTSKGAILFTGFPVDSLASFNNIVEAMGNKTLSYQFGSTPRTHLKNGIYTSTEYPSSQEIPMHNEMSYTKKWPEKIWFYCEEQAQSGGETPIADSRAVYDLIPVNIRNAFEKYGVKYRRNYYPSLDVPWQQVFQTDNAKEVGEYCGKHGIDLAWKGEILQTSQTCQASIELSNEKRSVWFNQAHLFHFSSLPEPLLSEMTRLFEEKEMPRNCYFGNNDPIPVPFIKSIIEAYSNCRILYKMKAGDILLLNNTIIAHGRMPFSGIRKVRVALTM